MTRNRSGTASRKLHPSWSTTKTSPAEEAIDYAGDRLLQVDATRARPTNSHALFYYTDPDIVCDTVMRLYNQDGELLATNDDMLYRLETDSALIFQATYDGPYYIEILEWSEETSVSRQNMTYDLFGRTLAGEIELNNDDEDVADYF